MTDFVLTEYHVRMPGTLDTACGLAIPDWVLEVRSNLVAHDDAKRCEPLCVRCEIMIGHNWNSLDSKTFICTRCKTQSPRAFPGRLMQCPVPFQPMKVTPDTPHEDYVAPKGKAGANEDIQKEYAAFAEKVLALIRAAPGDQQVQKTTWGEVCKHVRGNRDGRTGDLVDKMLLAGVISEQPRGTYWIPQAQEGEGA